MIRPPILTEQVWCSTFFFRDPGSGLGWSEKYFNDSSANAEDAHTAGINLCNLRTNMNVLAIQTQAVRTSDEKIQRDAYLTEGGQSFKGTQLTLASALDQDAEMPYSTALVREYNGSRYHAQRYLSGIPDKVIVDPPGPAPLAAWDNAFDAFKAALSGVSNRKGTTPTTWKFLALSKEPGDTVPSDVLAVIVNGGLLNITVKNVNVAVGDVVKIYNATWNVKPTNPGYLIVTAINPAAGLVTAAYGPGPAPGWLFGGSLRRLRYITQAISGYDLRGETHHKRGGRFFLPLGKSRKAK